MKITNRAHLVSLRGGSRGQATRFIPRINAIFNNADIDIALKLHELETKHQDLLNRYRTIEELDQQIFQMTQADALDDEIQATNLINIVIQDALSLIQHRINVLWRETDVMNPECHPDPTQQIQVSVPVPVRASNRPKITLPRFNGEILQWQPFWQAFQAEIDSDNALGNINKFNYLVGQLEPNVLITVAGLTTSNDNYPVLVNLLQERFEIIPKIIAAFMRALYTLSRPEGNLKRLRVFL